MYFHSLAKEARWADCIAMYQHARINASDHEHTFLDNAALELALTCVLFARVISRYQQFEHGWGIYEKMKELDRFTLAIAMTLCWKSFNHAEMSASNPARIEVCDSLIRC
jgi:hypothetical protein